MLLLNPITDNVYLHLFVKMVSAKFLHYEEINKHFMGI